MKQPILLVVCLSAMACASSAQSEKPAVAGPRPFAVFDLLTHEGKPNALPGTLKMAMVYESHEIHTALVAGRVADQPMWRSIDHYVRLGGRDAAAICLNLETYGPEYEISSQERQTRYDRITKLVLMIKERYGKPVGIYAWPPVIWPQHAGPSDAYVESVRQSKALMDAVDFFCPSAYMAAWWCADQRAGEDMRHWRIWNQSIVERLRTELLLTYNWTAVRKKPVYPFLAPVYEYGVEPKEWFGKPIGKERLKEQLAWCRMYADGAVLWGGVDLRDGNGNTKLKWREGWEWIGEAVGGK